MQSRTSMALGMYWDWARGELNPGSRGRGLSSPSHPNFLAPSPQQVPPGPPHSLAPFAVPGNRAWAGPHPMGLGHTPYPIPSVGKARLQCGSASLIVGVAFPPATDLVPRTTTDHPSSLLGHAKKRKIGQ